MEDSPSPSILGWLEERQTGQLPVLPVLGGLSPELRPGTGRGDAQLIVRVK